jgi:hypothetical protein
VAPAVCNSASPGPAKTQASVNGKKKQRHRIYASLHHKLSYVKRYSPPEARHGSVVLIEAAIIRFVCISCRPAAVAANSNHVSVRNKH